MDGPGNVRLSTGSQSHMPCDPREVRTSGTANPERGGEHGCWGRGTGCEVTADGSGFLLGIKMFWNWR